MLPLTPFRIFSAGLVAGTLDITAACLQYFFRNGKGPEGVLRFVASGLFGKEAFTGGGTKWITAGLLIHYSIALAFAFLFTVLARGIRPMQKNRLATGLLYGVFVWAVMNRLVLPLTKAPPLAGSLSGDLQAAGILILCIGLPLSFLLIRKSVNSELPSSSGKRSG